MYGTDKMLKTITIVLLVTSAVSTRVSVSAGTNPKSITGFARTANVTIGSPLGDQKSCPPSFSCRLGNKCCFRRPGTLKCNYRDCMPLESYLESEESEEDYAGSEEQS